jgi:hypothetical protein
MGIWFLTTGASSAMSTSKLGDIVAQYVQHNRYSADQYMMEAHSTVLSEQPIAQSQPQAKRGQLLHSPRKLYRTRYLASP